MSLLFALYVFSTTFGSDVILAPGKGKMKIKVGQIVRLEALIKGTKYALQRLYLRGFERHNKKNFERYGSIQHVWRLWTDKNGKKIGWKRGFVVDLRAIRPSKGTVRLIILDEAYQPKYRVKRRLVFKQKIKVENP